MAPLLCHEELTVAMVARCIKAIVASDAVTTVHPEDTGTVDPETLTWLVNTPAGLEHAVRATDSLRANGDMLVLFNLLADLGPSLDAATHPRRRSRTSLERSCRGCFRRGSFTRASCLLCAIPLRTP